MSASANMTRRGFLSAGVSFAALNVFSRAYAQADRVRPDRPAQSWLQGGQFTGLPADWQFLTPQQWNRVEAQVDRVAPAFDRFTPLPTQAEISGTRLSTSGTIEIGALDPVTASVALDASLADIVGEPNERLKLSVLNADFNPLSKRGATWTGRTDVIGPFSRPEEMFFGRLFTPVRHLLEKAFEAARLPETVTKPLLEQVTPIVVINTPAHQFRIDGKLGNRVVFYNGAPRGHEAIDRLAHATRKQNLRLIKLMVHLDGPAQGGGPKEIVRDGVGGATHIGGFSAGFRGGKPISVKSDWPSTYGWLNDENRTYNAHLLAIDYAGGTRQPLPAAAAAAYCHNADMWDCCAAMLVPFTNNDPNPSWRDYQYNPLEVYDQQSARNVSAALAAFDSQSFLGKHGAFYCAEGQYIVANLGPQEDSRGGTLLKKSRFGETAFGQRIINFGKAPDYAAMSPEQRRLHPEIGWEYLASLGQANGGISADQLKAMKQTDRTGIYLEWIPEETSGWQAYGTRQPEGLVARPMTVATMVWGLFRRYLPRERVAKAIVTEFTRIRVSGDPAAKRAVAALANGRDPSSPAGQAVLAGLATKAATGLLLGLLSSDEVRTRLLDQAGFGEISDQADKTRVTKAYGEFVELLKNADYSAPEKLDQALFEADERLAALTVARNYYNPVTNTTSARKSTLMLYAAPACFGMWAQFPFLAQTECIRYVATAMHTDQGA